ncbi:hypothetical protein C8J56DRAFT_891357 [Mycena floridula]|nr:hypothetical protein C8J56DRAFT_891357 [Mycena floridula]
MLACWLLMHLPALPLLLRLFLKLSGSVLWSLLTLTRVLGSPQQGAFDSPVRRDLTDNPISNLGFVLFILESIAVFASFSAALFHFGVFGRSGQYLVKPFQMMWRSTRRALSPIGSLGPLTSAVACPPSSAAPHSARSSISSVASSYMTSPFDDGTRMISAANLVTVPARVYSPNSSVASDSEWMSFGTSTSSGTPVPRYSQLSVTIIQDRCVDSYWVLVLYPCVIVQNLEFETRPSGARRLNGQGLNGHREKAESVTTARNLTPLACDRVSSAQFNQYESIVDKIVQEIQLGIEI